MENKQAVAVAVGVGAVGTALAYLGYSVYNKNEDISNLTEDVSNLTEEVTKPWWSNLWTNSNTEASMYNEVDEVGETVQLKEALKEEKNVKIEKKDPKVWQSFWKGEYDDAKKKDEE
jgi:hypothetical protein|tara:strand:- start:3118 stop:3468 length:351 start_codon:yes stop_codon:yes gene_type:complete